MRYLPFAVSALALIASASGVLAADPPRRPLPAIPVVQDDNDGWYLRGDIGYVHHKRPEVDFTATPVFGSSSRENIGDTAVAGAGIGYRFSPNFRADITLDHRFNTRFHGLDTGTAVSTADKGLFQSSTLMLNGYADLGTYYGFTPYVGAGIGVAHNLLSNVARLTASGDITDPETGEIFSSPGSYTRIGGGNQYNVAWALMAGVGYQLSSSFTLDVGYRYVSLGQVKGRSYAAGMGVEAESLGAHEVRMGLRYAFP